MAGSGSNQARQPPRQGGGGGADLDGVAAQHPRRIGFLAHLTTAATLVPTPSPARLPAWSARMS